MARDYAKKLLQMRVCSKTPAGKAAIARARAKSKIGRGSADKAMKIKPQSLLNAVALWR